MLCEGKLKNQNLEKQKLRLSYWGKKQERLATQQLENELIEELILKKNRVFKITDKGIAFTKEYNKMAEFMMLLDYEVSCILNGRSPSLYSGT